MNSVTSGKARIEAIRKPTREQQGLNALRAELCAMVEFNAADAAYNAADNTYPYTQEYIAVCVRRSNALNSLRIYVAADLCHMYRAHDKGE